MKNYKNKFCTLIVIALLFQQCANKKQEKVTDNKGLANAQQANKQQQEQDTPLLPVNIMAATATDRSYETWQVAYIQKPGKALAKIINNDKIATLQFILITNNINSYFYLSNTVESRTKEGMNKNINKYNAAPSYRSFNENRIVSNLNIVGTSIYYYKPVNENWQIDNEKVYSIQGVACKKAISKNYGKAYFSTDTTKRGGPNGIGGLPGLVIKLITPDEDEFLYSSATITNKKVSVPATVPIPEEKLNEAIAKVVAAKNKTITNSHTTVETKVTVSDSN